MVTADVQAQYMGSVRNRHSSTHVRPKTLIKSIEAVSGRRFVHQIAYPHFFAAIIQVNM